MIGKKLNRRLTRKLLWTLAIAIRFIFLARQSLCTHHKGNSNNCIKITHTHAYGIMPSPDTIFRSVLHFNSMCLIRSLVNLFYIISKDFAFVVFWFGSSVFVRDKVKVKKEFYEYTSTNFLNNIKWIFWTENKI